jgi:hypothetical protein
MINLRRLAAFELLTALRSLDGVSHDGTFTPFKLAPEVTDKIVDNIVKLRVIAEEADAHREELAKQLGEGKRMDPNHPRVAEFNEQWSHWMMDRIGIELQMLTKEELNMKENHIPISVRERLLPIVQA